MAEGLGGHLPPIDEKLDFSKIPVSPDSSGSTEKEGEVETVTDLANLPEGEATYTGDLPDYVETTSMSEERWERIFDAVEKEAEIEHAQRSEEAQIEAEAILEKMREQIIGIAKSTDELTGLKNFKSKYLQEEVIRPRILQAIRAKNPPTFLYMDLDGFKGINDTIGHDAGDMVLIAFAEAMETVFREEDIKGRDGGDEFGAILFNADPHKKEDAVTIVRKLSAEFSKRIMEIDEEILTRDGNKVPFPGEEVVNMVAFSAATAEMSSPNFLDAKDKADRLLQRAKEEGPAKWSKGVPKFLLGPTRLSRKLRGLPVPDEDGKNCLVVENAPHVRYEIEDNPNLEFKSKR